MKAKDKVLKIRPKAAVNYSIEGCRIIDYRSSDCRVALSNFQNRESSAWAEAYRILINTK